MDDARDDAYFSDEFFERLIDEGTGDSFRTSADPGADGKALRTKAVGMGALTLAAMPTAPDGSRHATALVSLHDMERALDALRPSILYVLDHAFDAQAEMLLYDDVDDDTLGDEPFAGLLAKWSAKDGSTFRTAVAFLHEGVLIQCLLVAGWFLGFEHEMEVALGDVEDDGTQHETEGEEEGSRH